MDKQAETDLIRQVNALEKRLDGLTKPEIGVQPIAAALAGEFSDLRGGWSMASFDENGDCYDLSGQGRTLTYNGNPVYGWDGLVPYIKLDGTGDYLSRADEAGLDILGNEAYVENPGLTLGCWVRFTNAASAQEVLISKGNGVAANTAYWLNRQATGEIRFIISDGAAFQGPTSTLTVAAGVWTFVVGRFIPSTSVDVLINGPSNTSSDVAGIPATTVNSASALNIGNYDTGALYTTGEISMAFLCVGALSDSILSNFYEQTRVGYGV